MNEAEQRQAATDFSNYWRNKGDEKSDCQRFWIDFIQDVLGIENATQKIEFEKRVNVDGQTKFIDVYIPETRTLIEQKSFTKNLKQEYVQSGGWMATPYQQGRRYSQYLPVDEAARWIIACNFKTFEIHDMNKPQDEPIEITLEEVRHKLPLFDFMFKKEVKELSHEMEISVKAGEIVGILYDKLLEQYKDPDEESLRSLNNLCVRLVFCLYAEDADIFGSRLMFHDYLKDIPVSGFRKALIELFKILDTKKEDRDKYLAEDNPALAAFPYVNGGLFADENIEIPPFTEELKSLLLEKASLDFDWSDISPTIFGAVFESTLNPETRRKGGMHYTSIENIHKVIDPLFMDDLNAEFDEISKIEITKERTKKLNLFQAKLSKLTFLDPACGSGNFLTETYISLRKLENKVLSLQRNGQMEIGTEEHNPIKVSIGQFYGIEINDFAVTVAKTALWIAESQMMKDTESILLMHIDFLPLKSYANIIEANALTKDWNEIVNVNTLSYIIGNPPFVGQAYRSKEQAEDMQTIFGKGSIENKQDYVICWFRKAYDFINQPTANVQVAFVSTNSICQGESVPTFWKYMCDNGAEIIFAHRTFIWDSEANDKAQVHCVIVGFTNHKVKNKFIFEKDKKVPAQNINPYLIDAPNIWLANRVNTNEFGLPKMTTGSPPTDDGGLLMTVEEKQEFLTKYPVLEKYIRPFLGSREFLHDKTGEYSRYCFWFVNGNPSDYVNIPEIKERLERVKNLRESSNADRIQKMAIYPYLFCQNRQPDTNYLIIPETSSERRRYIPMGFISPEVICSNAVKFVPEATLYHFGIMTSNVHMAWTRIVCGRMKSDYRYSPFIYNNFPWPKVTEEQKRHIEQTAQAILDARLLYNDCGLADLYDELTMPPELRKAHQQNDKAVMQAYGFSIKDTTEASCVAALMKMYEERTNNNNL